MALVLTPIPTLGRRLWRWLLRLERPRQAITPWSPLGIASVLVASLLVALVSSWPLLVQPSLMPGVASPFSVRAPREARVIDSAALEQRRNLIGARSQVQVVDERASRQLQDGLDGLLKELQLQISSAQPRLDPLNLSAAERTWLLQLTPQELLSWQQAVQKARDQVAAVVGAGGHQAPVLATRRPASRTAWHHRGRHCKCRRNRFRHRADQVAARISHRCSLRARLHCSVSDPLLSRTYP